MISNQIIYTENTIMIILIVCCLIAIAIVMIPKAIRHRKQLKQNENNNAVQHEHGMQMIAEPTGENKQLSYEEQFMIRNEIKDRSCVYIRRDTHCTIMKLTKAMDNISIGGYIDVVLREHLKQYRNEINKIYSESRKDLF